MKIHHFCILLVLGFTLTACNRPVDSTDASPKLLHITANVDGSGVIIFTSHRVHYEHKYWSRPTNVMFDDKPWTNLDDTPSAWNDSVTNLDLTKARITGRKGRDTIALEQTSNGFDLYLCDTPNGSADYEVTISIPHRN